MRSCVCSWQGLSLIQSAPTPDSYLIYLLEKFRIILDMQIVRTFYLALLLEDILEQKCLMLPNIQTQYFSWPRFQFKSSNVHQISDPKNVQWLAIQFCLSWNRSFLCLGLKMTAEAFFLFMFTVMLVAYTATSMALAISADQTVVAIANIFMTIACVFMMVMRMCCLMRPVHM